MLIGKPILNLPSLRVVVPPTAGVTLCRAVAFILRIVLSAEDPNAIEVLG